MKDNKESASVKNESVHQSGLHSLKLSLYDLMKSRSGIAIFVIISMLIIFLDYITGREIRLVYLLIVPVAVASLANHRYTAYGMAVVLPFVRFIFFFYWGETDDILVGFINAAIRSVVLIFVVYFFNQARLAYEYREKLAVQSLKDHVLKLEKMLPICCSCKKIRNEHGEYEGFETYITKHSESEFTHTICPECMQSLYPDMYEEMKAKKQREVRSQQKQNS